MSLSLKIPTGPKPDWEVGNEVKAPLKSIYDSGSIHHVLRQSRTAWLNNVFPKFTSKGRGKSQAELPQPPPHTLRFVSKCDVEIGPHIFFECQIYEAVYIYMPDPVEMSTGSNAIAPPASTPGASSSKATATPTLPAVSIAGVAKPAGAPESWKPEITPALIAQVNEAASTNPTLQSLLQLAAKGEATQDQLKTLGFFIQSLATAPKTRDAAPPIMYPSQTAGTTRPAMHAPYSVKRPGGKEPDLIIEFNETRGEKFRVPREIVACEQEITESSQNDKKQRDILMYTFVPFVNDDAKFKKMDKLQKTSTQTVIRLRNASHPLWECIRGWVNEESKKVEAWDNFFDKTEESSPRAYPQHRLMNNELAIQVQNALQGYPMKLLKPPSGIPTASSSRTRSRPRPSRSKKLVQDSESAMDVDSTKPAPL